jgi:DNA polymerase III alpha subunit (gram-positive type)
MRDDKYLYDKINRYVVFDVETTGLRLWRNDMTGPIHEDVSA